jgi:hypothetical protein
LTAKNAKDAERAKEKFIDREVLAERHSRNDVCEHLL